MRDADRAASQLAIGERFQVSVDADTDTHKGGRDNRGAIHRRRNPFIDPALVTRRSEGRVEQLLCSAAAIPRGAPFDCAPDTRVATLERALIGMRPPSDGPGRDRPLAARQRRATSPVRLICHSA